MELLMEVKLLSEVLDHLESNLIVVGTQVQLLLTTSLEMYNDLISHQIRYHLLTTSLRWSSLRDMMNFLVSYHEPF